MTETKPHIPEHKNRVYTLIGIGLAMFLGALDQTIVSTATPKIVENLNGLDRITWITTVYLLLSTVMVPIYGKLADIMSRKILTLIAVSVFLIGSALCGMAGEFGDIAGMDGMTQLIIFRAIQGLGGAGIFSLAFIIIADLYPPRERGKISGLFGAVFGLSSVIGPLLGGFLTDHASWRWVFYVNIPVGILALWFIIAKMPRLRPHDHNHAFNIPSALLMILAFGPLTLGLSLDKIKNPWDSAPVLALLITGGVFLILWIWHSLKTSNPIMELRLFKSKVFSTTFISGLFFGAGFFSVLIFMPMYMIFVQETSATQAGISIIPVVIGIVLGASTGGIIAGKMGRYKPLMIFGGAISVLAAFLITTLGLDTPYLAVVVFMLVCGLSFGPGQSLYSLAVQNDVEPKYMGQATSATQFSRQMGSTIGSAILGAIFTAVLATNMAANLPSAAGSNSTGTSFSQSKGIQEIRSGIFDQFMAGQGQANMGSLTPMNYDALLTRIEDSAKKAKEENKPHEKLSNFEKEIAIALKADKIDSLTPIFEATRYFPLNSKLQSSLEDIAKAPIEMRFAILDKVYFGLEQIENTAIYGMKKSFGDSINYVWWVGFFIMVVFFISNFFIPNKKLREKGEHAEPTPLH